MAQQNIFDNETFFDGYKKLRAGEKNANDLFEIPVLFSLLPDMKGKRVLDLGCGFGEHCKEYVRMGAERVYGIDISEKMLEVARKENSDPKITYELMPIEDIGKITEKFDIVISSLAFHYVEDFSGAVKTINSLLAEGGQFIFSQEHPFSTCFSGGERWTRDENGEKIYLNLKGYGYERENESSWFVDNIKKYHRMFSTIVNTLVEGGFIIDKMVEPLPNDEILAKYPDYTDLYHKPDFLIIRASKK
ncbi:MAG: class I SAM-dependent methyltransferase [Butyrivibrio sp.]|nr:class I SAM-dependent methyltransferase [Butyrivibrio sp.]